MINAGMSIKTVSTATAIAAIAPALRPLPESPREPFDGIVVSALPESTAEPFDGMIVSVLYKTEYILELINKILTNQL